MILVRIVAPHFVAGLETNGVVRRAAPILHYMVGWPDDRVRAYVKEQAWKTSVVADPQIIQHEDSFEVRDDNAGRTRGDGPDDTRGSLCRPRKPSSPTCSGAGVPIHSETTLGALPRRLRGSQ